MQCGLNILIIKPQYHKKQIFLDNNRQHTIRFEISFDLLNEIKSILNYFIVVQ